MELDADTLLRELDSLSDEALMEAYVGGDETAFALLIHRYERELFSYLRRMLADAALAEDVFQNTFLQVHQKRGLYELGRPVRPWLYTVATHQAIDAMRRNQRHRRISLNSEVMADRAHSSGSLLDTIAAESTDPLTDCERKERSELVRKAVDGLADHLRAVVVLGYYQGMKYKEIADILGIPVGTVKSRLHAAIRRLGELWQELGLGADG